VQLDPVEATTFIAKYDAKKCFRGVLVEYRVFRLRRKKEIKETKEKKDVGKNGRKMLKVARDWHMYR
jgi:hypothetical protein